MDISAWSNDEEESWDRWNLGDYPHELNEESANLLVLLQGKSPISFRAKDKHSWGSKSGKYTTAEGYAAILEVPWVPPNPGPWKSLWSYASIPKIDFFIWALLHNSILIGEKLKSKGWEGPSRCPLCNRAEETIEHLFIIYEFTKEVWRLTLGSISISLPNSITKLISCWISLAPFNFSKKNLLKLAWMWTP